MPIQCQLFSPPGALAYYLLGCYMSDGNVFKDAAGYRVSFYSKDQDFVEMVKNFIDTSGNVYKEKKQELFVFRKRSKFLGEWLIAHGCIPNKSLQLRWPEKLPQAYFRDFLRGYIDGDGSILLNNSKGTVWGNVKICSGSESFIDDVIKILKDEGFYFKKESRDKKPSIYSAKGGLVHYARLDNSHVKPFLNWLYYEQALPCLERKKIKADGILALYSNTITPREWEANRAIVKKLKKDGYSRSEISKLTGMTVPFIKKYTTGIDTKPIHTKHHITRQQKKDQAVAIYERTKSVEAVKNETGCSHSAAYSYLKDVLKRNVRSEDIQVIKDLRSKGLTLGQICEKTKFAKHLVKKYIRGTSYSKGDRSKITPEVVNILNGFFEEGIKNVEIIKNHGYKPSTVKKYRAMWRNSK